MPVILLFASCWFADCAGAHIYSLRKVLGDNMHFIAYGTWETMQDYEEHFK